MRPALGGVRPTPFGLWFLLLVLLTLVGCINYSLSLGYGLTFLLLGAWMLAGLHLDRTARLVRGTLQAAGPVTAGQAAPFTLQLAGLSTRMPLTLTVRGSQGQRVRLRQSAGGPDQPALPVGLPAPLRGPLTVTAARLVLSDAFGLWHVARPVTLPGPVTVSPAPTPSALPPATPHAAGDGQLRHMPGPDEFAGLRPYQPGDSPRQVSWRHAARTGQLLTRETDAPAGQARVLDWADTRGPTEARVSQLAGWVEAARLTGTPFALRVPGHPGAFGAGEAHAQAARAILAHLDPLPDPPKVAPASTDDLPDAGAWTTTLAALAFALAPLVLRQPLLMSVLTFGLLGYTFARLRRPLPAPGLAVLAGAAVLGGAYLNSVYGTLLGVDAGTAMLGLLLVLKAAESRTGRDARLLILLGLFQTSTHFFAGQGPLTALHTVLAATALLGAAARLTSPDAASGQPGLRVAGRMLALAVPLAALLFLLFPRPDGPLWRLPLSAAAQTGLANEITAGEYSALAQNDAVAFRADFGGTPPAPAERYWRGPVYEAYDGVRWTQVRLNGPNPTLTRTGPAVEYTLTLEPNGTPWLPALDTPVAVPVGAVLTTAFQAATRPTGARSRYRLSSAPARRGEREDPFRLDLNLRRPAGESPRAAQLGASWAALPAPERVQAGLAFLRQGDFTYTLTPPTLPERDRVDAFLYGTRRGFCEHYASAFAFLMRAAGVPARIVGGYLGGQVNPAGNYLIVRQQDAHAWVEVWLAGQGWVRVDPTAAIAPARVNANVGTALTRPQASAAPEPTALARARLGLDALQNRWNDLVVGYDGEQQRSALARIGVQGAAAQVGALAVGLVLAGAMALFFLRRQAAPRDPMQRTLDDLARRTGEPLGPGETLSAYAERVGALRPDMRPGLWRVRDLYHAARYAPQPGEAALRALREAVRKLR
ncbi:transglutaminaseTgpA domain-containing protein [Deinococcus ficus]|uniref:transglutaminaseTgpA domain-containing protein n=1 Tax=Deinococcus ficus TaxID=317577 RepID=UPI00174BBB05|nr:transglutaminaseTgpA domain-containing protein [Deinococcus ficus]GHF73416.1 transglutaminase [Deinococcus ficus]